MDHTTKIKTLRLLEAQLGSGIPVDQTTEVTVNKDTLTPRGTPRSSLKAGAVKVVLHVTAEYRSTLLGQVRHMVQGKKI